MPQNLNEPEPSPLFRTITDEEWQRLQQLNEAAKILHSNLNCFFGEQVPTVYTISHLVHANELLKSKIKFT